MNDYVPTDFQKKAFRVVEDECGGLYLDRVSHREFPTRNIDSAFQYSIAKWTVICESLEAGIDLQWCGESTTCALCVFCGSGCKGCPIGIYVRRLGCEKTPYVDFWPSDDIKTRLSVAKEELAFLQKVYRWWMMRVE